MAQCCNHFFFIYLFFVGTLVDVHSHSAVLKQAVGVGTEGGTGGRGEGVVWSLAFCIYTYSEQVLCQQQEGSVS